MRKMREFSSNCKAESRLGVWSVHCGSGSGSGSAGRLTFGVLDVSFAAAVREMKYVMHVHAHLTLGAGSPLYRVSLTLSELFAASFPRS